MPGVRRYFADAVAIELVLIPIFLAEIAAALVVGAETVKTHVAAACQKLGVRGRTQAVIAAYEAGFVRPGAP